MTPAALATLLAVGLTASPTPVSASGPAGAWRWPIDGTPVVARPFQRPPHPWAAGHRGVDLAAAPSSPVLAAGAGVVSFAGYVAGVGVVAVLHPGGLRTTYEPVAPEVVAGAVVGLGQPIGRLLPGHGFCGPGRWCLHWGLLRGAVYLDPLTLVRRGPVRLLPLVGAPTGLAAPRRAAIPAFAAGPTAGPPPTDPRAPEPTTAGRWVARPGFGSAATATAALAGWLARRRVGWGGGRLSPAGRRASP